MAVGAGSFLIGALLMRLIGGSSSKEEEQREDPRNHQIRGLEADRRALHRQSEEAQQALVDKDAEFNTSVETLREVRATLIDREEDIEELKADLKGSILKTRELRLELQSHASETIRQNVRAEEAETELEVTRAGSEAVLGEIGRLQEERKDLTNTMRRLEKNMLPDLEEKILPDIEENMLTDEALFGEKSD
jgi:uncharacterized protein YhaN